MWTPSGIRIVGSSPLRVPCRFCHAPRGTECTRPVPRRGRGKCKRAHDIRLTDAEQDAELHPPAEHDTPVPEDRVEDWHDRW